MKYLIAGMTIIGKITTPANL